MGEKANRYSYSIDGLGQISLEIPQLEMADMSRIAEAVMRPLVKTSADLLASRIQANAPKKTGDLSRGVIASAAPERSTDPGKVIHDIYFSAAMNDKFVKVTKSGKRYYYPASQEYGFRIGNGKRVPGKYYMRDASVEFYAEHRDRVAEGVDNILEEL